MRNFIVFFTVMVLAFSGCVNNQPVLIREGEEYGVTSGTFRDRWWNYYERALSFADGEFYEEAIGDLRTAIGKREKDQWRSRTYGMHFVDYFPHRELGIIYYKQKKYDEAARELEESLSSAESSKAKFFLNRTRKAILEETGKDTSPPILNINSPIDGFITNKFSIIVKATVEDDYFVSSYSVNNVLYPLELSAKKVSLEKEVSLNRGTNVLAIKAVDLTGKTSEKSVKIEVDREGPVIIVEDFEAIGRKAVITGFLSDGTGISSFSINDRNIPLDQGGMTVQDAKSEGSTHEFEFRQEIDLSETSDTMVLKAKDSAENITTGELRVNSQRTSRLKGLPMTVSLVPVATVAVREQYAFLDGAIGKIIDNTFPVVSLKNLNDTQTVYDDAIFIEGKVSDDSKIKSLTINGESVLKRSGKEIFFNHLDTLDEGVNRFTIVAIDTFGNETTKNFTVIRKIPVIRQLSSRMRISILPLEQKGEKTMAGGAVYDNLIAALAEQRRFNLIERERMDAILNELKLSQTELVDPGTAAKVGRVAVADAIMTGTIYETKDSIEVLTRLVDTETSTIIDSEDVFDQEKSLSNLKVLMAGLALKYRQSFPVLEGIIIKKEGKGVLIDLGSSEKVREEMGVILYREGEQLRHPVTGRVLGSEPVELGEGRIEDVHENFSKAIIRKGKPENVRIQDRVITK